MSQKNTPFVSFFLNSLNKWTGAGLIIACYFFLIRPLRVMFVTALVPMIQSKLIEVPLVELAKSSTTVILTVLNSSYFTSSTAQSFTYSPAFNLFFCLACVGLWMLGDLKQSIMSLSLINLLGWLIATLFLAIGLFNHPTWWIASDLITVYLIPMASMALVAVRYSYLSSNDDIIQ